MATVSDAATQTIELLKQAKPLFEGPDPYLLTLIAIFGTVLGALASFFPMYWHSKSQRKQLRNSVAAQIYAEVKATLHVEQHRGYIRSIKEIVGAFERGEIDGFTYQVQVPEERFVIYNANIQNLSLLDGSLQVKVVTLYQLMEAVVQDIKPGGVLNVTPAGHTQFSELLSILLNIRGLADEVLASIESQYPEATK